MELLSSFDVVSAGLILFSGLFAYFRGLIATSKLYVPDKKIKNKEGDPEKRKSPFVTFITLGISDTQWIDVVAWGPRKLAKIHCLEGYGVWEDDSWIRVENMNMSRLL